MEREFIGPGCSDTTSFGKVLGIFHHDWSGAGLFADVIRQHGLDLEVVDITKTDLSVTAAGDYTAVIVFGGSQQVDQEQLHPWLRNEKALIRHAVDTGTPLLGVCLGSQLLADVTGARVGPARVSRRGWGDVATSPAAAGDDIFAALPRVFRSVVWHDYESQLPPQAIELGRSATALQAFRIRNRPAWGVQFHPEAGREDIAVWIDQLRQAEPNTVDADMQLYLDEAAVYEDKQRELARLICGKFLGHALSLQR